MEDIQNDNKETMITSSTRVVDENNTLVVELDQHLKDTKALQILPKGKCKITQTKTSIKKKNKPIPKRSKQIEDNKWIKCSHPPLSPTRASFGCHLKSLPRCLNISGINVMSANISLPN